MWLFGNVRSQCAPPLSDNVMNSSKDNNTAAGKAFLSMLLTLKASGGKVEVWYSASSAVGTNETSGCDHLTMSDVVGLAAR